MSSRVKLILFSLFIILVSILMLGTGLYFNQLSKSSHIMGVVVDQLEEGFFHYLYPHDDLFVGDEFTIDGNVQFDLDSEYYKTTSEDEKEKEIAHEIKNFDQLGNHFLVKQKAKEKQAFLEFEASIGEEKLIGEKILVQNATE